MKLTLQSLRLFFLKVLNRTRRSTSVETWEPEYFFLNFFSPVITCTSDALTTLQFSRILFRTWLSEFHEFVDI